MQRVRYPILAEVEDASHYRLCVWHRFLPSPGMNLLDAIVGTPTKDQYDRVQRVQLEEAEVLKAITARMKALGGFTPEILRRLAGGPT